MKPAGKDHIAASIKPYLLYGIMASIVFSLLNINSYFIVALTACWLIEGKVSDKWQLLKSDLFFLACFLYFLSQVVGIFLAPDFVTGWKHLEKKMGFLAFPVIFCSSRFITRQLLQKLLVAFSLFLTAASIACLVIATYYFSGTHNIELFFYHDLLRPIDQHAVYFSAYILISIVFLTTEARKVGYLKNRPILLTAWILFNVGMMVLLSSKLMLGILAGYFIYLVFLYQTEKYRKAYFIGAAAVITTTALLVVLTDNPVKKRFTELSKGSIELIQSKKFDPGVYFTGLQFRLLLWRVTGEILNERQAWWTGVGPANSGSYLQEKYRELNIFTGNETSTGKGYLEYDNCHNQFLQAVLDSGIPGLAVFIFWLCVFAVKCFKKKKFMLSWIFIIIFLFFFSESVLERQYGIILATFLPLLLLYESRTNVTTAGTLQSAARSDLN